MVEYWACVGLACADEDFRRQLEQDAPRATKEYGFRLSAFELASLENLVAQKKAVDAMLAVGEYICPLPPKPCPMHSARSSDYQAYKRKHLSVVKHLTSVPSSQMPPGKTA